MSTEVITAVGQYTQVRDLFGRSVEETVVDTVREFDLAMTHDQEADLRLANKLYARYAKSVQGTNKHVLFEVREVGAPLILSANGAIVEGIEDKRKEAISLINR